MTMPPSGDRGRAPADRAIGTATALFTSHGYFVAPDSPLKGWSKSAWETEWAPFGLDPWDPAWDDGSRG